MNIAAKNSLYYTIGSIARAMASFVLMPIYANILGASQYGVLNLLQTFSAIAAPIMTLSVEKSIYRLYFDKHTKTERNEFLSTVFWSINLSGFVVIVICVLLGNKIVDYLGGVEVVTIFYPVVVYTFLSALITYCQVLLQTQQQGAKYLMVSLLMLIGYNVITIILLYNWSPTYKSEVYASLVTNFFVFLVAFMLIKEQISFCFSKTVFRQILKYTFPLFFMSMFSWVLSTSDRLFIANYQGTSDVGLYSIAFKICTMGLILAASIKSAFDPYFFQISNCENATTAKNLLQPIIDTIVFINSLIFIAVALFGKFFVDTFLTIEYHDSVVYIYILSIAFLFTQQASILDLMILQNKKTLILSIITIISGLISVLLNILFIPKLGSVMAAIDSTVVSFIMFVITFIYAKKNFYIKVNVGNIWCPIIVIILCYVFDLFIDKVYLCTAIKVLVSIVSILTFIKLKTMTCPTLGTFIKSAIDRYRSKI